MDETDAPKPDNPESGQNDPKKDGLARSLGLGIITGAADDDVSASEHTPAPAHNSGRRSFGSLRSCFR
jgi:hypothetical protein